jgi:hypothetical protein
MEEMKDIEITQAIEALQSIKDAYEKACKNIDDEVAKQQYIEFNGVKIPRTNITIDWKKVEQIKLKAIDWNKVVELIERLIPLNNIDKIKNIKNQNKLNEYKTLVNYVMGKLTFLQRNRIKYINFWDSQGPITMPTTGDIEDIPDWVKWVAGVIVFIILMKACS